MAERSTTRFAIAAVAVALVGGLGLVACQLPGPQFVVGTTTDAVDANPGDGVCEATAGAGDCTLRAAVMEANAEPGSNDIEIGDGHTYLLTIGGLGEDHAATGDLDITDSVSINGHSTIDGGGLDHVFDVRAAPVIIDGPTVQHGANSAIVVSDGADLSLMNATLQDNFTTGNGAGISTVGTTTVTGSRLQRNVAQGELSLEVNRFVHGGAIDAGGGSLTVSQSTLTDNRVVDNGDGGAIGSQGSALVTIDRSTVAHNLAPTGGEGVVANAGAAAKVRQSTFSGYFGSVLMGSFDISSSTFSDLGGPVFGGATTALVRGSALNSRSANCTPPGGSDAGVTSGGYNRASDSTCALAAVGDVQGSPLLLHLLGDNGGPTQTHLPFANSPLVDAIPSGTTGLCDAGATDQRGVARPQGGACDAGAVEGASAQPAVGLHLVVSSAGDTGDATPGNGVCDGGAGGCTLRAAIEEANAWPTADQITIAAGVNPSVSHLTSNSEFLRNDGDLVIDGGGATVTAVGAPATSFARSVVASGSGALELRHLTVASSGVEDAAVTNDGSSLHIVDSTVLGAPNPFVPGLGTTGITSGGSLTVESSTITGNPNGAIRSQGPLVVLASTVAGNGAFRTTNVAPGVIGLFRSAPGADPIQAVIVSSTIAGNTGTVGLANTAPVEVHIEGSVLDQTGGAACSGAVASSGYNLVADSTCGFTVVGDQQNVASQLGPLAVNGGPTKTRLPLAGSPVLDKIPAGTPLLCTPGTTDQRHVARPVGAACDKGAVEGTVVVP